MKTNTPTIPEAVYYMLHTECLMNETSNDGKTLNTLFRVGDHATKGFISRCSELNKDLNVYFWHDKAKEAFLHFNQLTK